MPAELAAAKAGASSGRRAGEEAGEDDPQQRGAYMSRANTGGEGGVAVERSATDPSGEAGGELDARQSAWSALISTTSRAPNNLDSNCLGCRRLWSDVHSLA